MRAKNLIKADIAHLSYASGEKLTTRLMITLMKELRLTLGDCMEIQKGNLQDAYKKVDQLN